MPVVKKPRISALKHPQETTNEETNLEVRSDSSWSVVDETRQPLDEASPSEVMPNKCIVANENFPIDNAAGGVINVTDISKKKGSSLLPPEGPTRDAYIKEFDEFCLAAEERDKMKFAEMEKKWEEEDRAMEARFASYANRTTCDAAFTRRPISNAAAALQTAFPPHLDYASEPNFPILFTSGERDPTYRQQARYNSTQQPSYLDLTLANDIDHQYDRNVANLQATIKQLAEVVNEAQAAMHLALATDQAKLAEDRQEFKEKQGKEKDTAEKAQLDFDKRVQAHAESAEVIEQRLQADCEATTAAEHNIKSERQIDEKLAAQKAKLKGERAKFDDEKASFEKKWSEYLSKMAHLADEKAILSLRAARVDERIQKLAADRAEFEEDNSQPQTTNLTAVKIVECPEDKSKEQMAAITALTDEVKRYHAAVQHGENKSATVTELEKQVKLLQDRIDQYGGDPISYQGKMNALAREREDFEKKCAKRNKQLDDREGRLVKREQDLDQYKTRLDEQEADVGSREVSAKEAESEAATQSADANIVEGEALVLKQEYETKLQLLKVREQEIADQQHALRQPAQLIPAPPTATVTSTITPTAIVQPPVHNLPPSTVQSQPSFGPPPVLPASIPAPMPAPVSAPPPHVAQYPQQSVYPPQQPIYGPQPPVQTPYWTPVNRYGW